MNMSRSPLLPLALGLLVPLACTAPDVLDGGSGDGSSSDGSSDGGINLGSGGQNGGGDIDGIKDAPATATCADGVRDEDEACDDGNKDSGDGCAANCRYVEEGFVCAEPGKPCSPFAQCGDGKVVFPEQCDDAGRVDGDGCSDICKVEVGYKCDGAPSTCTPTVCGDGVQEGAETCEGADGMPFDGCGLTCQAEPNCSSEGCTSICGDGLIIAPEKCDDGNATSGDGCSAECQVEPGYDCSQAAACTGDDCVLRLPIIFRDFNSTHSDFYPVGDKTCDGLTDGLASAMLDAAGKPSLAGSSPCVSSQASFSEWYGATAGDYATIVDSIDLYKNDAGAYVNRYGAAGEPWTKVATQEQTATVRCEEAGCCDGEDPWNCCEANDTTCMPCTYNPAAGCEQTLAELDGNPLFFPLDAHPEALMAASDSDRGPAKIPSQIYGGVGWPWENPACAEGDTWGICKAKGDASLEHNFFFTSEIAYWFKYEEGINATLTFIGDDDVWVYFNRRLLLDLGGIHVPLAGSVSLGQGGNVALRTWTPGEANAPTAMPQNPMDVPLSMSTTTADALGMVPGGVYEIRVFHAERKPEGSSFQLTLSGFNTSRSECVNICGDGILAAGEQCDNGVENNVGGHNGCNQDCTLGAFCGDGVVQEGQEECDDNAVDAPADCAGCRIIKVK